MRLVTKIQMLLEAAYFEKQIEKNFSKTQLAANLGVDKSHVTRLLQGRKNMTLETFSNLAYELGKNVRVELVDRQASVMQHYVLFGTEVTNIHYINTRSSTHISNVIDVITPAVDSTVPVHYSGRC